MHFILRKMHLLIFSSSFHILLWEFDLFMTFGPNFFTEQWEWLVKDFQRWEMCKGKAFFKTFWKYFLKMKCRTMIFKMLKNVLESNTDIRYKMPGSRYKRTNRLSEWKHRNSEVLKLFFSLGSWRNVHGQSITQRYLIINVWIATW